MMNQTSSTTTSATLEAAARDKEREIRAFLLDLRKARDLFVWRLDPLTGIRGEHPEVQHDMCPIMAVHFHKTGRAHKTKYDHPDGDPHRVCEQHGWAIASIDLVHAIDRATDNPLAEQMKKILGIKEPK